MLNAKYAEPLARQCRLLDDSSQIPAGDIEKLEVDPNFLRSFDKGPEAFLQPIQKSLPASYNAALEAFVASALLVNDDMPEMWLIDASFELRERLVIAPATTLWKREDPAWAEALSCLPLALRGFHSHFNGLHTSWLPGRGGPTAHACNLPGGIFKWSNIDVYQSTKKLRRSKFAKLKDKLGDLQQIRIWIQSDWGDLVLLNQNAKDQRLYHVSGDDFEQYVELADPETTIDNYCAHVLSGVKAPFNFRA